jgi:hypothetical protein
MSDARERLSMGNLKLASEVVLRIFKPSAASDES